MQTRSKNSEKIIGSTSNFVAMEYKMKDELHLRIIKLQKLNVLPPSIKNK